MNDTDLAKIAYLGYGEAVGYKNYEGKPMPDWKDLGSKIQNAWIAATVAVVDQLAALDDSDVTAAD